MAADLRKILSVGVLLIFQFKLSTCTQEVLPLKGNNSCGVYPGEIIRLECATASITATTMYEIDWPDSTTCSLRLLNSRFQAGTIAENKDECGMAIACANRIEGDNYVSNITITVPNITQTSPTSHSVIVRCLSSEIPEPVGTATFNVILNDRFSFPGKVASATINPEKQACMFSIDSNCSIDNYYMYHHSSSTNCSDCYYNDTIFICDEVSPGETCHLSALASLNGFTSLESDPAFCLGATLEDVTTPSSSSNNAIAITFGVLVPLVGIIAIVASMIIIGILYYRKKRRKWKMNDSQIHFVGQQHSHQSAQPHTVGRPLDESPHAPIPDQNVPNSSSAPQALASGDRSTPASEDDGFGGRVDETSSRAKDEIDCQADQLPKDTHAHGPESSTDARPLASQDSVDQLRREMNEMNEQFSQQNQAMEKKLNNLRTEMEMKTQQLNEKVGKIFELQQTIDEKNKEIERKDKELEEKDEQLQQKDEELLQKDKQLQEKESMIDKLQTERDELEKRKTSLETERDGLINQLQNLSQQANVMQDDVKFTKKESEEEKDKGLKQIMDALSEQQGVIFEAIAKAIYVEKSSHKATTPYTSSNGSARPQVQLTGK